MLEVRKSKFMAINMPQGQRREKEISLLLEVAQIAPSLQFGHIPPFFLDNYRVVMIILILRSGDDQFLAR